MTDHKSLTREAIPSIIKSTGIVDDMVRGSIDNRVWNVLHAVRDADMVAHLVDKAIEEGVEIRSLLGAQDIRDLEMAIGITWTNLEALLEGTASLVREYHKMDHPGDDDPLPEPPCEGAPQADDGVDSETGETEQQAASSEASPEASESAESPS